MNIRNRSCPLYEHKLRNFRVSAELPNFALATLPLSVNQKFIDSYFMSRTAPWPLLLTGLGPMKTRSPTDEYIDEQARARSHVHI